MNLIFLNPSFIAFDEVGLIDCFWVCNYLIYSLLGMGNGRCLKNVRLMDTNICKENVSYKNIKLNRY